MMTRRQADPSRWDLDRLVEFFGALDDAARNGALAIMAHHLTVETRMLLSEPRIDRAALDRVRAINEFEHHLTSRLHPDGLRTPDGDASLLRDIIADAARSGLTAAVKRALLVAVRNAQTNAELTAPAH